MLYNKRRCGKGRKKAEKRRRKKATKRGKYTALLVCHKIRKDAKNAEKRQKKATKEG